MPKPKEPKPEGRSIKIANNLNELSLNELYELREKIDYIIEKRS